MPELNLVADDGKARPRNVAVVTDDGAAWLHMDRVDVHGSRVSVTAPLTTTQARQLAQFILDNTQEV